MPSVGFITPDLSFGDSSDDSIRRLTDDYGRHRLTDVLEEESEEESFGHYSYRKKYYSIGSAGSSMDALWELHPRRLSEAGLSRHSDSSAVLTEDTDSFIIGQRVWVSGTKPGHIAYIGETQFAPGEWAGIALDEPIGKNDGSVGGIRYFQCEAKKGVFARLTRLTRFPMAQEGMGSGDTYVSSPSPVGNGVRRSPVSPTGSTRGLLRSPGAVGGSNTSLTSGTSHVIDYKLGDRVIIKSSQGSKVGTVKYMGTTEFANGDWVGVELDDPRGKNDGSVNGIRYFDCRPNFGLFAPVSKVSKSPSKIKPNACQVHSGTGAGLPPTGIRKVNSKESLLSNRSLLSNVSLTSASAPRVRLGVNSLTPKKSTPKTTSTPLPARTALQDLLKEKQQHIEQLLKERDIERSEITKAASEAEETDRKLTALRTEYDKYRSECEKTLQEHMNMFNQLKEDRNRLVSQLDEEKRKIEDLQFRLAETSISNEDIEKKILAQDVANESHIKRIKELEEQLAKERDKTDSLEREAYKLFEAEENLMKSKVEIESLRKQLQEAVNRQLSMEDDSVTSTVLVASLHTEVDQYKTDLEERNEMVSVLKAEISKLNSEAKKQIEEISTKKTELEVLCNTKDEELSRLKQNLDHVDKLLQDKVTELEKIANEKLNSETALEKEINRLKMEISAKVLNLENVTESTKAQEGNIATLMNEIQSLKEQLDEKAVEKEQLKVDLLKQIVDKDALMGELNVTNSKQLEEIKLLNEEIEKLRQSSAESVNELKEKFNKTIENDTNEFNSLKLEFDKKNDELTKSVESYNNIKFDFESLKKQTDEIINQKDSEITKNLENCNNLRVELENLKKQTDELINQKNEELTKNSETYNNLKTDFEHFKKQYDETLNQKNTEFAKSVENYNNQKIDLENLKKQSDETLAQKNVEIENLAESLKEKETLIQTLQLDLQTTKIDLDSVSGNLKQYQTNLSDVEANLKKERDEIKETLKTKIIEMEEAKKQLSEDVADKVGQLHQLTVSLEQKSEEADKLLKEITSLKENHETVVKDLNDKHSKEVIEKDKKLEEFRNVIEIKTKDYNDAVNKTSEIEKQCKNQASEMVKLREDFENKQKEKQMVCETVSQLTENLTKTEQIKSDLQTMNDLLKNTVTDLENTIKTQAEDVSAKATELQTTTNTLKEKDEQILSLQTEVSNTKETLNKATEALKTYQSNLSDIEITLKKEKEDLQATLDIKNQETENIKAEMNLKITESETRLSEANNNLGLKNEEVEKLKNQIIDIKIEHEKYIREISDRFKGGYGEMEEKISDLLTELENKNSVISNLNKNITDIENTANETNINMEKLKNEFEASQQQNLSGVESLVNLQENIKKLTEEKDDIVKQLQNSQDLVTKVSEEKEKLKNEVEVLSSKAKESDEILTNNTKQLQESQQNFETTKTDYEKKIKSLEITVNNLEEANKNQQTDFDKQKLEYEDLIKTAFDSEETLKDLLASNKDPDKIKELQKNVEGIKSNLQAKDKLLSERNNEISKLKEELKKAKSQQIGNGSTDVVQLNPVQINQSPDYQQLLEEKIFAESQVSFLNSIIVDMQKKNEEQKARIEILEMGYSASAADELAALGFNTDVKTPAPRMYCDICEEFDLHETEDCPTQGEDEQPLVNPHLEEKPKHKPPPRAYCEICGEFGHATEDCTVDHEF